MTIFENAFAAADGSNANTTLRVQNDDTGTTLNASGNWWGTTDPEEVESWILFWDWGPLNVVVDYLPMADGPMATEPVSWSEMKALFR